MKNLSARAGNCPATVAPPPRLPQAPRTWLEGPIHLVLGLAAVVMVWLLLGTITAFVPRAGLVAERLRQPIESSRGTAYAQTNLDARSVERAAAGADPAPGPKRPTGQPGPPRTPPVS
jgi:hypothetical protein